jgi:hypothetical protein
MEFAHSLVLRVLVSYTREDFVGIALHCESMGSTIYLNIIHI